VLLVIAQDASFIFFLPKALGNSVLHSSVITLLKLAQKQGHCFNEEELFDEGGWREV